jgi:hypothetical protein
MVSSFGGLAGLAGPDRSALYRLADPKCKTWNKVGDMKLVPWPEAGS